MKTNGFMRSKWKDISKILTKEFIISSTAQFLYLFQTVIQNKIFTSCFSLEVFGEWSLLISAYTLISMLPFSALDQGIYRIADACKKQENEKKMYTMVSAIYFSGFAIYTIAFCIINFVQKDLFFANGYLFLFLIYAFSEILKNTYVIIDNSYRKRQRVLNTHVFGIVSRTILFLITYAIDKFTINSVLGIMIITNGIILLYQREYLFNIPSRINKEDWNAIGLPVLKFSAPLLTWAIFGWMQNMISRWYLDALLDKSTVAMYSVLTTISFFVPNAVYTILNAYVMPITFSNNKPYNYKSLLKYVGAVSALLMCYWLGVLFLGKYLVLLLADTKYLEICKYLPFTTLSSILYVVAMLSTIEIYRRGHTKKLIISTITPGLFMATVGFFLIRNNGMNGAVTNYMLGHIIYAAFTFCVVFNKKNIT